MNPEIREQGPQDFISTLTGILENSETKPSKESLEVIGEPKEANNSVVIFLEFRNKDLRDKVVSSIPVNADFEVKKSDPSNLIIKGIFSKQEIEELKKNHTIKC